MFDVRVRRVRTKNILYMKDSDPSVHAAHGALQYGTITQSISFLLSAVTLCVIVFLSSDDIFFVIFIPDKKSSAKRKVGVCSFGTYGTSTTSTCTILF